MSFVCLLVLCVSLCLPAGKMHTIWKFKKTVCYSYRKTWNLSLRCTQSSWRGFISITALKDGLFLGVTRLIRSCSLWVAFSGKRRIEMFPFYLWVSCKCVPTGDSALRERGPRAPLGRADAPASSTQSPTGWGFSLHRYLLVLQSTEARRSLCWFPQHRRSDWVRKGLNISDKTLWVIRSSPFSLHLGTRGCLKKLA